MSISNSWRIIKDYHERNSEVPCKHCVLIARHRGDFGDSVSYEYRIPYTLSVAGNMCSEYVCLDCVLEAAQELNNDER